MRATYDPKADALSIDLVVGVKRHRTVRVEPGILAHFDKQDRLIELEVLMASGRYAAEELAGLESPGTYLTIPEAAAEAGLSPVTLRLQISNGRLKAEKRGLAWFVSRAALFNYLESRETRGRQPRSRKGKKLRAQAETEKAGK